MIYAFGYFSVGMLCGYFSGSALADSYLGVTDAWDEAIFLAAMCMWSYYCAVMEFQKSTERRW